MFAQRADVIFRKLIAFIDKSADFAYKAFLAFCLWFWFYIFLIVGVCHSIDVVDYTSLCYGTDEHSVCIKIYILLYLQRHECVDIFWQEHKSVVGTKCLHICKFVCCSSALESKVLEYAERSLCGQAVYVHHTSLFDNMVGIVCLIDINCHTERRVCQLCNCIDDQSVILLAIIGCYYIQTVSDTE